MTRTLMAMALAASMLFGTNLAAQEPPADKPAATVNINSASAAQLDELPGIGPKVAQRIVEYRQKNGPFRKVEELMNVKGIGEKSFLKLKPQLSVGAPKPEKAAGVQP